MWSKVVGGASLPTPFLAFSLSQTQATNHLGKLCLAHRVTEQCPPHAKLKSCSQ